MHVPKAAGTSVASALADALSTSRSGYHFDRHHFGRIDQPSLISPERRARVCWDAADLLGNEGFVGGHISLSTFLVGRPTAQYVTVFREPVSRILSHWLFHRAVPDAQIEPWGPNWAIIMQQARGTLIDFLEAPTGAPQSDNLMLRMVLRPHPLIPDADFIDQGNDEILLPEAVERLRHFAFLDVIENPAFDRNLATWLGKPLRIQRLNEAPQIPPALRRGMLAELTDTAFDILRSRSRLDLALWSRVASTRIPGIDIRELALRTIVRFMLRHSLSMN